MASARPTVSVFELGADEKVIGTVGLPDVLTAPIRTDLVHFVHTNVAKNKRQAYCVKYDAGMEYAAESWGTGRAVSRIPRVPGGGTHRAGQAAFGNMCRGGRMFHPTRQWRKWHRKVNKNQRRYAICSALAASSVPAIVMARGHRINDVPELPLVVGGSGLIDLNKTKAGVAALAGVGATADVEKVQASKKIRAGKGKMRQNRRYVKRRGPLVIHDSDATANLSKALRNIEGVDLCHVDRLNLLALAPGGRVGRFIIWTQPALEKLEKLYGSLGGKAELKSNYTLPRPQMVTADVSRIIESDEIQKVSRAAKVANLTHGRKKNPLRNFNNMLKLNPAAAVERRKAIKANEVKATRKAKVARRGKGNSKAERRAFYAKMLE